jgi:hypothetical protein
MSRYNVLCDLLLERHLQLLHVCFSREQFKLHTRLPSFDLIGLDTRLLVQDWVTLML